MMENAAAMLPRNIIALKAYHLAFILGPFSSFPLRDGAPAALDLERSGRVLLKE